MIKPQRLKINDRIAIIASSKFVTPQDVKNASIAFKSWGLELKYGQHLFAQHHQQAGTDEERLHDLQQALDDPDIKAVIFARGGYGLTRIIDQLDFTQFKKSPKWICGFSDITALIGLLNNLGFEAMHAPMPIFFNLGLSQRSQELFKRALLTGHQTISVEPSEGQLEGRAEGELVGGNLSMICNALGTSSEIIMYGKILFLEDLTEYYYHIDRMMVQLDRAGKLKNLSGLVVGQFSKLQDNDPPFGKSANEIILEHCGKYDYPIAFNFPVGHEPENFTLICGRETRLEVTSQSVRLKQ